MKLAQRIGLVLLLIAGAVGLAVSGAYAFDTQATRSAGFSYPPRGELLTVSGAQMHVICRGNADPSGLTLVLQAGIGGGALDWLPLMAELDESARVCAFDRFGQDWSDPAPTPRTFATAADELKLALDHMEIEQPVLVGHSLGGAVVQIYAANYPVSGIVLIDGLTAAAAPDVVRRLGGYQSLDWLAPTGLLRPIAGLFADSAYSPMLRAEMRALRGQARILRQMTTEGALAATSGAAELAAASLPAETPLLVIAAAANGLPEEEVFRRGLKELAENHAGADYHEIAGASHYVIASHPAQLAEILDAWLTKREPDGDKPGGEQ